MRDTVLEQYLAKMGFLRDDYLKWGIPHGTPHFKTINVKLNLEVWKTRN